MAETAVRTRCIYRGYGQTRRVLICGFGGGIMQLDPARSLKVWNHSPDGFNWGYGGSGPAQLALAILLDRGETEGVAVRMHQDFKFDIIAPLEQGKDFELESETVDIWIAEWKKRSEQRTGPEIKT
jgi:hypothetical protein